MKITYKFAVIVTIIGLTMTAQAATLEELKGLWRAKKYHQVIPLLLQFRDQPGGRTWEVDYLIGTSECRIAGKENDGAAVLKYLLSNYRMSDEARAATEHELKFCQQADSASQTEPPFFYIPVSGQVASGPLVAGKGGFDISQTEVGSTKVEIVPVPIAELRKRRITASEIHGNSTDVAVVGKDFVINCPNCNFPPRFTGECLEKYKLPLQSEFDMKMPEDRITVYVANGLAHVHDYARQLHGIDLPNETIAYSVYEDLSIVGWAAYMECGSLAHELVHLAIRQNFGDSPPWLEEGLASEVAVAYPKKNRMQFESSWRDDMLRRYWNLRPTVAQLLAANWTSYSTNNVEEVGQVAALQAMAAVFIRYLDAKEKLGQVYFYMRDGRFTPRGTMAHTDQEILQKQMGMDLDKIDADFVRWFRLK